jgi:hypothetical protein
LRLRWKRRLQPPTLKKNWNTRKLLRGNYLRPFWSNTSTTFSDIMASPSPSPEEKTWKVVTTHLRHPRREEADGLAHPCPLYILNPHLLHLPFKKRFSFFDCNCADDKLNSDGFVTPVEKTLKIIIKSISSKSLSSSSSSSSWRSHVRTSATTRSSSFSSSSSSSAYQDDNEEDPDYIVLSSDNDKNDDKVYTYSTPRSKRKRQYRAAKKRKLFQ